MKKYCLLILLALAVMFPIALLANNISSLVLVQISGNGLVIGTPGAVNLGTFAPGEMKTYTFSGANFFWIRDLRGLSQGHYTTIQCDGLYQQGGDGVITGVVFKATAGTLSGGLANQTQVYSGLQEGLDITQPMLYFYRNNGGHNGGVTNRYIDYPTITITVPSGTPSGTYKGRITYTLYDTSFNYSE